MKLDAQALAPPARHGQAARRARRGRGPHPLRRRRGARPAAQASGQRLRPRHPASPRRSGRAAGGGHQGGPDRDRPWHRHRGQRRPPGRGHDAAPRRLDRRPPRHRRLHRRLARRRRAARFHHQRADGRPRVAASCSIISAASPTSRRAACASSATRCERIAEDHLRILRFFRFHARFGAGEPDRAGARRLHRPRQRFDGAVARAHRRRAVKLLAVADPCPTVELMVGRGILGRCFPRSSAGAARLRAWSPPSATAGCRRRAAPARRACCPPIPTWPNRSRPGSSCPTGRASGSPAPPARDVAASRAPAYRVGPQCAADRLLLAGSRRCRRDCRLETAQAADRRRRADRRGIAAGAGSRAHAASDRGPLDRRASRTAPRSAKSSPSAVVQIRLSVNRNSIRALGRQMVNWVITIGARWGRDASIVRPAGMTAALGAPRFLPRPRRRRHHRQGQRQGRQAAGAQAIRDFDLGTCAWPRAGRREPPALPATVFSTCPAPLTCSGGPRSRSIMCGHNQIAVRISAPDVRLVNQAIRRRC